jgi:hypothetical protein
MVQNVAPVPVPTRRHYRAHVATPALVILDDEGEEVLLDAEEAANLFTLTGDLDAATVSACPQCRSRILAVVALADLLDDAPLFIRAGELVELADDAPTLHVYVRDLGVQCVHRAWLDPGFEEWSDVMTELAEGGRPAAR